METIQETLDPRILKCNWLGVLEKAEYVAFDTENNGHINLFDDGVIITGFSICVKVENEYLAEYFPVAHGRGLNYDRSVWEPILRLAISKKVIAHNVNFDARSARMLLDEDLDKPFDYFFDTTNMAHLVNENLFDSKQRGPLSTPSLENCCKYFLGYAGKEKSVIFKALLAAYGWHGIAGSEIREYGESDAIAAYKLWEKLASLLAKEPDADNINFWKKIEMPNMKVLYNMKTLGVGIDEEFCKEWEERCDREMYKLREDMGFDPAKPTQLKPIIYDVLKLPVILNKKTKQPTLDKAAMEVYDIMLEGMENPIAKQISQYRGWSKASSSYYSAYLRWVDSDGRLRPDFKSHGTLNRRYACVNPNLQQIPKTDDEKLLSKPWSAHVLECFVPIEGYELWQFDYSQLELRMGAAFGNDKKLLDVFNDPADRDIFSEMAAEMGWGRQETKGFVYSIDYGAGAGRIADVFKLGNNSKGLAKAKEYIDDFYEQYPGLGRANRKAKFEAESTGRLRYWAGHYRHFNGREEGYKAFNSKIQGGSADLVKKVMNTIARERPDIRMVSQVHDALWFELPTASIEQDKRDIIRIMEDPFDGEDMVTFKVDGQRIGGKTFARS